MKRKRNLFVVLALVFILLVALSATAALADTTVESAKRSVHAPVCYKMNSYVPGHYELQCTDAGRDIMDVTVKGSGKYFLYWNNETVILRITDNGEVNTIYWTVCDKAGSLVSGTLP